VEENHLVTAKRIALKPNKQPTVAGGMFTEVVVMIEDWNQLTGSSNAKSTAKSEVFGCGGR
jgi:hypothetical protein